MGGVFLINQNLYQSILKAYDTYVNNEKIEQFQYVLESSINALEGVEGEKKLKLKEVINDLEYARFLISKSEQPKKVKESITKLKEILGV